MQTHAEAVLDSAWDAGIRYFDAARSYGQAEAFLEHWLAGRHINPGAVVVGSKWGYTYTAGWRVTAEKHEIKDHSLTTLLRQAAESRAVLGNHLNLYQIHSATLESGVLDDGAVLAELDRLKWTGLKVGLTVTGPRQAETLRRALDVKVAGERLFDCVQATWNLLERSAGPLLEEAHALGLGVIIKEALANGRLTSRNADANFAIKRGQLEEEAARLRTTLDALALAAVLAEPWADVVLSGAATVEQLRSNLAAVTVPWDDQAGDQLQRISERPDDYWAIRAELRWN
jgi:aryl-alcohol dehydrogenase-like predicted oxidoreductase